MEAFDIHRINKAPGIFDVKKLTWFNAEYIRRLTPEKYLEMVTPWFDKVFGDSSKMDYKRLAELMQGRTEVFNLVPDMVRFLAQLPDYDSAIYINKKAKTNKEACLKALNLLRPVLDGITEWTEPVIHDTVMAAIAEAGMKNATALWPLRIAISGQQSTPGGAIESLTCWQGGNPAPRGRRYPPRERNAGRVRVSLRYHRTIRRRQPTTSFVRCYPKKRITKGLNPRDEGMGEA